ncbi:ribonuclease H-like domain-containing protein [Tanacetum coccineum]
MANDDEGVDPNLNSKSDSSHSSVPDGDVMTANLPNNSRIDADSTEDIFAGQDELVTILEDNIFSKGNLDQNPNTSTQGTQNLRSEMDALLRNKTWDIVTLPKDMKAIGSKWIFKIKYKSSGEIDRYKT